MTDEMMDLQQLFEKAPDADFLREMIGFAAKRLMELEVGGLTGAAWGVSALRLVQRNGYRERDWETRAGAIRCASRSCARGATSRASSTRGGWRSGRSSPSFRRPTSRASRRARSTTSSGRSG